MDNWCLLHTAPPRAFLHVQLSTGHSAVTGFQRILSLGRDTHRHPHGWGDGPRAHTPIMGGVGTLSWEIHGLHNPVSTQLRDQWPNQAGWQVQPTDQIQPPSIFISKGLLAHSHAACFHVSMPAFMLQKQRWTVVTPQNQNYVLSDPV